MKKSSKTAAVLYCMLLASSKAAAKPGSAWPPTDREFQKVDAAVSRFKLTGVPFEKRIRVYTSQIEGIHHYIIGVLIRPISSYPNYKKYETDKNDPTTWIPGRYVVSPSKFPTRVSVVVDNSCDRIRVNFDVDASRLLPFGCHQ